MPGAAMVVRALSGATVVLLNAPRKTKEFISEAMTLPELCQFRDHLEIVDRHMKLGPAVSRRNVRSFDAICVGDGSAGFSLRI